MSEETKAVDAEAKTAKRGRGRPIGPKNRPKAIKDAPVEAPAAPAQA